MLELEKKIRSLDENSRVPVSGLLDVTTGRRYIIHRDVIGRAIREYLDGKGTPAHILEMERGRE